MLRACTSIACGTFILVCGITAPAAAQRDQAPRHDYEVAVGLMVPGGSRLRDIQLGPAVRVGAVTHWPVQGGSAYRLDAEVYRLRDRNASPSRRGITGAGVGFSWLGVAPAAAWRPYVLAGLGLHLVLQDGGDTYPFIPGVIRAGVGMRGTIRGVDAQVEVGAQGWIRSVSETRLHPISVALHF